MQPDYSDIPTAVLVLYITDVANIRYYSLNANIRMIFRYSVFGRIVVRFAE